MKARLGWLVAVIGAGAVALSASAQGSAKLAVGPDAGGYLCPDGRKIWVSHCYDQSAQASCQVVHLHVKNNGLNPETASTRTELLASLKNCVLTPLEFTNSGVNLVLPKSAPPQQTAKAPAASPAPKTSTAATPRNIRVTDGMAIGQNGVRSSLVRISPPGAARIFYVDEASRRATAQDVVTIWSLAVYLDGKPVVSGSTAAWSEYVINCKQNSLEMVTFVALDGQAKVLSSAKVSVRENVTKGTVSELVASIACKPAEPFKGSRFVSAAKAIVGSPRAGESFRDCEDCPAMRSIAAGSFTVGSPAGEAGRSSNEGPQRRVAVSAFAASIYEVTWAEYKRCVAAGACASLTPDGFGDALFWPVTNVSWMEAIAYTTWLSKMSGKGYRLLSEAEWEYAARAGTTTPYPWGSSANHEYANYGKDECCAGLALGEDKWVNSSVGGASGENAFSLADMHGNVWEWVNDCYADTYAAAQRSDASAYTTASCSFRVSRGGAWDSDPHTLRSAVRVRTDPLSRRNNLGFRVARSLP